MIKQAKHEDFNKIYRLFKANEDNKYLHWLKHPLCLRLYVLLGRKYYLSWADGKMIGYVATNKNLIGDLLIDSEYRNRGFGTMLRVCIENKVLQEFGSIIIYCGVGAKSYYLTKGYETISNKKTRLGFLKMFKEVSQNEKKQIING